MGIQTIISHHSSPPGVGGGGGLLGLKHALEVVIQNGCGISFFNLYGLELSRCIEENYVQKC